MQPGDLIEWNYGENRLRGVVLKKSGYFGWEVYFSKINKINHMEASALRKLQETK